LEWTRDPEPTLYEKECLQLVEGLSSGQLVVVEDSWQSFITEFSMFMNAIGKKVSRHVPLAVMKG